MKMLYLCNPRANAECRKGSCQKECFFTTKKEYALDPDGLYYYKTAIPIEWIEEWGWKNGMSESMSLRVMIDDWEKENENNSD